MNDITPKVILLLVEVVLVSVVIVLLFFQDYKTKKSEKKDTQHYTIYAGIKLINNDGVKKIYDKIKSKKKSGYNPSPVSDLFIPFYEIKITGKDAAEVEKKFISHKATLASLNSINIKMKPETKGKSKDIYMSITFNDDAEKNRIFNLIETELGKLNLGKSKIQFIKKNNIVMFTSKCIFTEKNAMKNNYKETLDLTNLSIRKEVRKNNN